MRPPTRGRTGFEAPLLCAAAIACALCRIAPDAVHAQAGTQGRWTTLPYTMPINPIHLALMRNGKVLVIAGSGNLATETNYTAAVWDPAAGTIVTQSLGWDMFCNDMAMLPDGRVFVNGGNLQYDPFYGEPRSAIFDPASEGFIDIENMVHGRWYPTVTELGDGRMLTFGGFTETGSTNTTVEIYTPGAGWSQPYSAGWTPPLYPRMHLVPDGRVFYSGSGRGSRFFDPATNKWSAVVATTNYGSTRKYGSSVLLPLSPADAYRPRVMIFGGNSPATDTTEIIDLSAATPTWKYGPSMSQPRIEMSATILPDGTVLAMGGSQTNEDASTSSYNADLYDPATNTFSSAGANAYPRLYHSASLLLPDATIALVGGNPVRGSYQKQIEIYEPKYLFAPDGSRAVRPVISDVRPVELTYDASAQIETPDAASIQSVVLMRPGTPTHAFDNEQRLVQLRFTREAGLLNVTMPPNGNIAPPGYYMLFILSGAGTPSIGRFVHLPPGPGNQPPTATITNPASNVTIQAGRSVTVSGTGTDQDGTIGGYAWSFPGGNPSSSNSANPGAVLYSTAGSYTATFRVTDNSGLTSAAASRTITVRDFSLAASPASQSVQQGGSATFGVTVTPKQGFSGTVAFSVSGLPPGATASFNPASIAGSGSTSLVVATGTSTPTGSYVLTITGTSGILSHSVSVTLVVQGDVSMAVTPASLTITKGSTAQFNVAVTAGTGFSATMTFGISGLPKFASATFTPTSVSGSGTSVLAIKTNKNIGAGTYPLTVSASGGGRVHTATVTLTVQ